MQKKISASLFVLATGIVGFIIAVTMTDNSWFYLGIPVVFIGVFVYLGICLWKDKKQKKQITQETEIEETEERKEYSKLNAQSILLLLVFVGFVLGFIIFAILDRMVIALICLGIAFVYILVVIGITDFLKTKKLK